MNRPILTPKQRLIIYNRAYLALLRKGNYFLWLGLCWAIKVADRNYTRIKINDFPELMIFKPSNPHGLWWRDKYTQENYQSRLFALALAIAMVQDEIKLQK